MRVLTVFSLGLSFSFDNRSLHPNGHHLLSAGLDCTVNVWDLRMFGGGGGHKKKGGNPTPVCHYNGGKSVNSAFFSPSGTYAVSTTQANKLDVFENMHVVEGSRKNPVCKPLHSIRHDNKTGRWLTTFQAAWHPVLDVFVSGSMQQPRCVELWEPAGGRRLKACAGDAMTAVASRCAFHPRTDRLIVAGGNSSGRVTIVR
jgi:WD40 repeat protein